MSKISLQPVAGALAGTELLPCVQGAGAGSNKQVTINTLKTFVLEAGLAGLMAATATANRTGAKTIRFETLTASRVPYLDANKDLQSSAVTSVELAHLSGVNAPIQTQIDDLESDLGAALAQSSFRDACKVASTADIPSMGTLLTIDGVVLADNDRVLVKDQSVAWRNGIWLAKPGAWVRATDFAAGTSPKISGATIPVIAGATNGGKLFMCTNPPGVNVGVDNLTFVQP